jgi:hypothetical protein
LRIMRMFKPSKTPAAIPNRFAGTFWVRTMGPGMCDCHNSRAILTKAGIRENKMLVLLFHAATGMVATDA